MRVTCSLVFLVCQAGCFCPSIPAAILRSPADEARQLQARIFPVSTRFESLSLAEFKERAALFKSVVALPRLESSAEAIHESVSNAIRRAELALDEIASCRHDWVSFANTIGALDDVHSEVNLTANRLHLLQETSMNRGLREAATEGARKLAEWAVGIDYREDVYKIVRKYAETEPKLDGEEAKLFREVLRDYRRAGLELPKAARAEVESWRKDLTRLTTDFESNITRVRKPVKFTRAELDGVPDDFLRQEGIKTGDDEFTILANVTFHYLAVMENARSEETRRKLMVIQNNLAREENAPLLQRIVELRDTIARRLGYATWADYQIEPRMARTAANALAFCHQLKTGLQPKFAEELEEFRNLKAKETGDPNAVVHLWDWRYYNNQFKKERFTVDTEALRVYFPFETSLAGMFRIYQHIFGLRFDRAEPPQKWCEDLLLFAVSDAETAEPLGFFYLDMFPREGKYNHFAQFPLIEGKLLPGGRYQRPTVALICNFPPPSADRPSLLSHEEVETLFHEFGHAMHSILTRAKFSRFAGTSVPRDFVEAPSQMLERWVWDKRVLDTFAADYRHPNRAIPAKTLARLKEAELATMGTYYRRQLSLAMLDLALHTQVTADNRRNAMELANEVLGEVFLPVPEGTAFAASFGHLMGYDGGYYGYAWADAIAADLATVFEKSVRGFQDARAGRRLRDEIYAPGDSRDVTVSIERFLGRKPSLDPFFKTLGLRGGKR